MKIRGKRIIMEIRILKKNSIKHFMLYLPTIITCPFIFMENSWIVPLWGSILILNSVSNIFFTDYLFSDGILKVSNEGVKLVLSKKTTELKWDEIQVMTVFVEKNTTANQVFLNIFHNSRKPIKLKLCKLNIFGKTKDTFEKFEQYLISIEKNNKLVQVDYFLMDDLPT